MDSIAFPIIILLAQAIICGSFSQHLATLKGHGEANWFFAGFLFGIFGLIAAAGLPDRASVPPAPASSSSDLPEGVDSQCKGGNVCSACAFELDLGALACPACKTELPAEDICALLIEGLAKEGAPGKEACEALIQQKPPGLIQSLLPLLEGDSRSALNAAVVLGELGEIKAIPGLLGVLQAPDLCKEGFHSKRVLVAEQASHALGLIGDPSSVRPLLETLGRGGKVDQMILEAIVEIGESALPTLREVSISGVRGRKKIALGLITRIQSHSQ